VNPYEGLDDAEASGAWIPGPPWILGHRGTPHEAPENTLAGMRRAVDVALDGFEYDLRACASGEAVLLHDATLERTTDATGALAARSLPELFGIDAGAWFAKRYAGEPLALFDEVLEIAGSDGQGWPLHMIELKERGLVGRVAEKLRELAPQLDVRVASFLRDVVLEARDAELPSMLLAVSADADDRRFVRDERLVAYGVGPGGWSSAAGAADWSFCEQWGWTQDEPEDLLDACRRPLFAFNTNEPYRALAVRALTRLAPDDDGPYPLSVPTLVVEPEHLDGATRARGEWYGSWEPTAEVRNPFPFTVEVRCGAFVRSGAFELEGLPRAFDLAPGEVQRVPFRITGGARIPGGDPLFGALFKWKGMAVRKGELRAGSQLLLDVPLRRERRTLADGLARRLTLLAERPGDPPASLTLRREAGQLIVALENAGGLDDAHCVARLGGEVVRGGRGLRLSLPASFDQRPDGLPFSCGIEGKCDGERRIRRWAGGVPEGLGHGAPGRVLPEAAG
jgi:glycerophosphoryl diester phosphodiesterase